METSEQLLISINVGTKEMSQIETTSYKWLIQTLLSYHTRQQTKSPRNQIK